MAPFGGLSPAENEPSQGALDRRPAAAEGAFPDIVIYPPRDFISVDHWRFHSPGKIQALARQVERVGAKVLVVNRPVYPFVTAIARRDKWRSWVRNRRAIQPVRENLFVVTPFAPLPDPLAHRLPAGTLLNRYVLGRGVRRALRRLRFSSSLIAWLYHPYQLHYLGMTGESLTVYEICDEEAVRGIGGTVDTIAQLERTMLARADVVFTTSRALWEAKREYRADIHWIPNAADVELFRRTQDPDLDIAPAVRDLPHPVVGYLGTIHEHVDIALVKYLAEVRPRWTVLMIGPEEDRAFARSELCKSFRRLPNVRMLGYVPQEEAPAYCKAFDVGIIPFRRDSRFNHYRNPLKLYEYTAMGKPVVSTRIPEVESHKDLIWIVDTPDQFVAHIGEALATDRPERIAERLERARANSWDVRVAEMLSIVQAKLPS